MLSAYFDESGGRDTGHFLIGGFIAPKLRWEQIERRWNTTLAAYSAPPFHAVDVAQGQEDFGDRTVWPRERRERLTRALTDLLIDMRPASMMSVIDVEAFERLAPKALQRSLGIDPYIICFLHLAGLCATTAAPDLTTHVWFAEHPRYRLFRLAALYTKLKGLGGSLLVQAASAEHFGPMTLGSPDKVPLLQAADLFVYSTGRAIREPQRTDFWSEIAIALRPKGIGGAGLMSDAQVSDYLGSERLMKALRLLAEKKPRSDRNQS